MLNAVSALRIDEVGIALTLGDKEVAITAGSSESHSAFQQDGGDSLIRIGGILNGDRPWLGAFFCTADLNFTTNLDEKILQPLFALGTQKSDPLQIPYQYQIDRVLPHGVLFLPACLFDEFQVGCDLSMQESL